MAKRLGKERYLALRKAKFRARGQRVEIKCPECHGVVGIPGRPILGGVEEDTELMLPTTMAREAWICEKCGYQTGWFPGARLNRAVRETHERIASERNHTEGP